MRGEKHPSTATTRVKPHLASEFGKGGDNDSRTRKKKRLYKSKKKENQGKAAQHVILGKWPGQLSTGG